MPRPNFIVLVLGLSAGLALTIFELAARSPSPVDARIVSIEKAPLASSKLVTVEFRRLQPAAYFTTGLIMQVRLQGVWQRPLDIRGLEKTGLFTGTNCERIVLAVPEQTEDLRFLLAYCAGANPRCKTSSFLWRHGIGQRFPNLCRVLLKFVPCTAPLKHVEIEVSLPRETHRITGANALRLNANIG